MPAALVAGLGLPALGALIFLAVLAAGVACWVFGSDARTDRVSQVLLAWARPPQPPARRRCCRIYPGAAVAASSALAPQATERLQSDRMRLTRDNGSLSLVPSLHC